jgi:hypothetical protein
MGFLDKLLGRKKDDSGMQTATEPASMPADDAPDHSHDAGDEHDHSHDEGEPGHTH